MQTNFIRLSPNRIDYGRRPCEFTNAAAVVFASHSARIAFPRLRIPNVAEVAKLNDAQTLEDAHAWLNSRERLAVLNNRALIAMLARLPNAAAQASAAAQPNAA
ncbi:MAG TPA: hypothetical protein VGL12_11435 [Roseiarcus sp.]